jgi:hypothetical protein
MVTVLSSLSVGYLLRGATIGGHNMNPGLLPRERCVEGNLPTVGRPARHGRV